MLGVETEYNKKLLSTLNYKIQQLHTKNNNIKADWTAKHSSKPPKIDFFWVKIPKITKAE